MNAGYGVVQKGEVKGEGGTGWVVDRDRAGGWLGSFGANNNYNNNSGNGGGVGDEDKYVVHAPTIITTITVTT